MTMPGGRTLADAYVALHVNANGVPEDVRKQTEGPVGDAGEKAGSHFGKRMTKAILAAAAVGAAAIGVKLVGELRKSIAAAGDLNETIQRTDAIFGSASGTIKEWAKTTATSMGQTTKSSLDAAATFAIYGKQAGKTGEDLNKFAIDLTGLASDMASFSNTTPEDAIESLGAAFRGESDPIEKYGVLINEARLQAVALDKGIIKSVQNAAKVKAANLAVTEAQAKYNAEVKKHGKNSAEARKASIKLELAQDRLKTATEGTVPQLTAQQRILAVQAALYDQLGKSGANAIGDFERNTAGLANQQRIAQANTENLRAEIGQAFLPVVLKLYETFNAKVIPVLQKLWRENGPALVAFFSDITTKAGAWIDKLGEIDWREVGAAIGAFFSNLKKEAGPALQTIKDSAGPVGEALTTKVIPALKEAKDAAGTGLADTLKVTGAAMGFVADHLDLLVKALPYLVAAIVAYKVAQLAANIAAAAEPVVRIAQVAATRAQTKAMREQTAALVANRTATITSTAATGAQTGAESVGLLTKLRNTAATIASTVATKAVQAATVVWTGIQWALNAALTANPIGLVVAAIVALIAIVVLAYKKNETFRKIVNAVWAGIKMAIKATVDWFVNTAWPWIKKVLDWLGAGFKVYWSVVKAVWKGVWDAIALYFGFIRDKVFNPLKTLITKTIPDAFRSGTAAIGKAWELVKSAASKPVDFVVNTVLNKGIIGSLNWLADKVGISKKIPTISYSGGGDGYGRRSAPARGSMMGDGLGSVLMNPVKWFNDKIGIGKIKDKFGHNPFVDVLTGGATRMKDFALEKVRSLLSELFGRGGGSVGAGGLRSGIAGVLGTLRAAFGNVPLISGLRPGSRTLSGNISYHASGRAIDIAPVRAWAEFIHGRYGSQLRELITPWQDLNLLNGHAHRYTGPVWNQHNFAGGNAHIHAAMDKGGWLVPGWNEPIYNGTGRLEPITPPATMDEVAELLSAILAALNRLAPDIGRELTGASAAALTLARTRG